jgi:hypothetical protein
MGVPPEYATFRQHKPPRNFATTAGRNLLNLAFGSYYRLLAHYSKMGQSPNCRPSGQNPTREKSYAQPW